ncbi:MAG: zinc ABC transporter substrate-binding protein [Tenericutes bacterium]|nr:zinc ABC transporter substrate-binding protein [Mycoplasmatota bacterium]
MKKIIVLLITLVLSITLLSCAQEDPHDVYVTVYPLKYVTEEIFKGTSYTVDIVPGVTSHESSVDWSPKEIIAMTESTYLFYVGANYDQYIDQNIESIFTDRVVELIKIEDETSYVEFIPGIIHSHECEFHEDEDEHEDEDALGIDPHFWISPLKIQQIAALIYDKILLKFDDPDQLMETNYLNLLSNLQELSDDFELVISNAQKVALTSTNIYGYLRSDYAFDYLSISPGYHEEAEQFTSAEKQEIVNDAIDHSIQYIIYERFTSSPLSNAVFDEMVRLDLEPIKIEFNILQALSDDEIEGGADYITEMYNNLELLKLALGYEPE